MSKFTGLGDNPLKSAWITPTALLNIRAHGRDADGASSKSLFDYFFAFNPARSRVNIVMVMGSNR